MEAAGAKIKYGDLARFAPVMSHERKSLLGRRPQREGSGARKSPRSGLGPGLQGALQFGDDPAGLRDSPVLDDGPRLQAQGPESSEGGDRMSEIIPKEFLLCDLCNRTLVNEKGEVLEDFVWTDWGLICSEKFEELDENDFEVIAEFKEADEISKDHELFTPMKITWF